MYGTNHIHTPLQPQTQSRRAHLLELWDGSLLLSSWITAFAKMNLQVADVKSLVIGNVLFIAICSCPVRRRMYSAINDRFHVAVRLFRKYIGHRLYQNAVSTKRWQQAHELLGKCAIYVLAAFWHLLWSTGFMQVMENLTWQYFENNCGWLIPHCWKGHGKSWSFNSS